MSTLKNKVEIPVCQKFALDYHEAAEYFGIGINRLREITADASCGCTVQVGEKRRILIIRSKFEEYMLSHQII